MKCTMCDNAKPLKAIRVTMKYDACGLDNVTLKGVEVHKCHECGEEYYSFGDMEKLHEAIAHILILKKGALTAKELRFLRTYLGYSGTMFARLTGYQKETVSRIENQKQLPTKTFDVLVRALVAAKLPDRQYDLHDMWLNETGKNFRRIELHSHNGGWHAKLAA